MNVEVVRYIIRFLLGKAASQDGIDRYVSYGALGEETREPCVVQIIPSSFFALHTYGTQDAYPSLPLGEWRGVPLLFGQAHEERKGGSGPVKLYADIVASSFFLLSRYEEICRRHIRDEHGRFPGRESLPFKAGFIHRPVVDEYGKQLRTLLREVGVDVPEPNEGFAHVNLTHDVDAPYEYYGFRSLMRAVLKEKMPPMQAIQKCYVQTSQDRAFTFPRLIEWDRAARTQIGKQKSDIIFFFKVPTHRVEDKPHYKLDGAMMAPLMALIKKHDLSIGLHSSYAASLDPTRIAREKQILEHTWERTIDRNRHHYLAAREPEDMTTLLHSGIRHDYTMGYADVAGFRLGTSRPVRFMRPSTRVLTDLVMHPLMIMDCTLSRSYYMNLDYEQALSYSRSIIKHTYAHGGELSILWHNNMINREIHPWQSTLYRNLLLLIGSLAIKARGGIT